jgi:hypothetical protein
MILMIAKNATAIAAERRDEYAREERIKKVQEKAGGMITAEQWSRTVLASALCIWQSIDIMITNIELLCMHNQ